MNYSYNKFYFVNNEQILDMFICKICHCVSKDPYETQCCRNTFCKSCIDKARRSGIISCPVCRKQPYSITQAVQIDRHIKILKIYCKNRNQGCTWTGTLESKDIHLKTCELNFAIVRCEYHIVGCDAKVKRIDQSKHNKEKMEMHFRMVSKKVNDTQQQVNDTQQQLKKSEQRLKGARQQVEESNKRINLLWKELECTKAKLDDRNYYVGLFVIFIIVTFVTFICTLIYKRYV